MSITIEKSHLDKPYNKIPNLKAIYREDTGYGATQWSGTTQTGNPYTYQYCTSGGTYYTLQQSNKPDKIVLEFNDNTELKLTDKEFDVMTELLYKDTEWDDILMVIGI